MKTEDVYQEVMAQIARRTGLEGGVGLHTPFVDLGIDSIGLITMLAELEISVGLNLDSIAEVGSPRNVAELLSLTKQPLREPPR
ncbi:MAG TPA: acyl carrier protein [Rhizomicrobium sp.]